MRLLLWGLLLAAMAIVASLFAQGEYGEHGNVVFLVSPWRIDVSLNFFLLLLAGGAFLWFVAAYFAVRVVDFPARVRVYRERREEIGSQRALRESVRALLEGRFSRAEREARAAQATPENAGIASLLGARAAHRMQEYERRDAWLDQAALEPDVRTARLVTGAEMWAESRENARALEALDRLHATGSRHVHAARVALSAHAQAGRWLDVLKGVRALAKRNAVHPSLARRLRVRAQRALLGERRHDGAALETAWNRVPAAERLMPDLALEAARLLTLAGRGQAAANAIEAALTDSWDSPVHAALLDEYARAPSLPVRLRIERAEAWLAGHPRDAALLRCLGLLCLRDQLWGKAKTYLADSLREDPHPATLLALARLAETLGDDAQAARQYREAALGFARAAMAPSAEVPLPERQGDATL
jgi:HemY protein